VLYIFAGRMEIKNNKVKTWEGGEVRLSALLVKRKQRMVKALAGNVLGKRVSVSEWKSN
jgi:hypothetical protein